MILNTENTKVSTYELLKPMKEFSNVSWYKINIQKYVAFLYTNSKLSERTSKITIPVSKLFQLFQSKRKKFTGVNLTKEVTDL